jgi:hypothetical protein
MMKDVKVKFDYSLSDFVEKANKVISDTQKESVNIIKQCASAFANGAQKFSPPCIGKNSIEKKFYERPFLVLLRLIRGGYAGMSASQDDIQQFRNGMIYKVLNTKSPLTYRSNVAFGYCKTKGQLKKMCRIENRGLGRVMWGKNLDEIGVNVPSTIQRLLNKSRNLNSLDFNKNTLIENNDSVSVEIENKASYFERWGRFAEKKGYENANKTLKIRLRLIAERHKEL